MHRHYRTTARVIAYAIPQADRRKQTLWALAAGVLTSIAVYAVAMLFS